MGTHILCAYILDKMANITFKDSKKTTETVSKLLSSVLPGHLGIESTRNNKKSLSSASQIINAQQKKIDPEKLRKLQKKQKLVKRKEVRQNRESRQKIDSKARFEVLQNHSKNGTLTNEEKLELKKLIKKNIAGLETWRTEIEDDLVEVQQEILELKQSKRTKQTKRDAKQLYEKKKEHRYPGLTPGLAPVGLADSDSEDEF